MHYTSTYESPLGNLLLAADEAGLTGLWFEGQKYYANNFKSEISVDSECILPYFSQAKKWLDIYFKGEDPGTIPAVHFIGTDFQKEVWNILCGIPYGQTVTYGDIAGKLAQKRGIERMSAQAVGGAVGRNPVSIIVPCHRVVGSSGKLTGYAGGLDRKAALLSLERVELPNFFY